MKTNVAARSVKSDTVRSLTAELDAQNDATEALIALLDGVLGRIGSVQDTHPCGCPADTVTTPMRGFRAQCGSCAAVFEVPDPITRTTETVSA